MSSTPPSLADRTDKGCLTSTITPAIGDTFNARERKESRTGIGREGEYKTASVATFNSIRESQCHSRQFRASWLAYRGRGIRCPEDRGEEKKKGGRRECRHFRRPNRKFRCEPFRFVRERPFSGPRRDNGHGRSAYRPRHPLATTTTTPLSKEEGGGGRGESWGSETRTLWKDEL